MRKLSLRILIIVLGLALVSFAQDAPQSSPSAPPDKSDKDKEKEKKEKKDKKDKKKKEQNDELNTEVFSSAVANDVLGLIRDGLEGHSQRLLLSAFDGDKMDGYLSFEDQIQAMFDRYEGFRVHYRILQQSVENNKGIVLALFEMEELPKNGGPPQRKAQQVRFELERGRKGWRVVDYGPRGFFS